MDGYERVHFFGDLAHSIWLYPTTMSSVPPPPGFLPAAMQRDTSMPGGRHPGPPSSSAAAWWSPAAMEGAGLYGGPHSAPLPAAPAPAAATAAAGGGGGAGAPVALAASVAVETPYSERSSAAPGPVSTSSSGGYATGFQSLLPRFQAAPGPVSTSSSGGYATGFQSSVPQYQAAPGPVSTSSSGGYATGFHSLLPQYQAAPGPVSTSSSGGYATGFQSSVPQYQATHEQPIGVATMASTGSGSGDNTSSGGCTTPNSNPNYDSDAKSDCIEESHNHEEAYHVCGYCKQPYSDPRVLDCLHTFCLYCLQNMINHAHNGDKYGDIECVRCKGTTSLETGNLSTDTVPDYARRRYIEKFTFTSEDNVICRSCKVGNPAIARCYECVTFLCDMCTPQHGKLHRYSSHRVISLNDTFERLNNDSICSAHLDYPRQATQYCHVCRLSYCEDCHHQHHYPSHKVVSITDSSSFPEMMINIDIEMKMSQEKMTDFASGIKKLGHCSRHCLEDLQRLKAQTISVINQRYEHMEQALSQYVIGTQEAASHLFKAHFEFSQQLQELNKFIEAQCKNAIPLDNLQTKTFVEKILKKINNSKPDPHQNLRFEFELIPGNPMDATQCLGSISLVAPLVDQQIPGYQQQPIARPTSVNRSSANQNYGGVDSYQNADTVSGSNGYRQYSSFSQQSQAYRSNNSSQSSDMNQGGYYGYEQRSQQRNSYDPFPSQSSYQRSSSSPMTVSQPNSASMVSDSVFDFSNLHIDRNDGTNTNFYSSSQNQNRPYQAWSNGIDGSAGAPPPTDDIFTRSSLFQVPDGTGSSTSRAVTPIRRTRMQFISKFGEYGNSQGQFTEPSGVAIDSENRLIVADTNNSRIQIFDIHGRFLSQFGSSSTSKLTYPNRIAVSKVTGKVVITERAPSHRVQTYTIDGKHLKTFGEEILQHPRGVAVDRNDNIIIIECKVMRVTIFSMDGEVLDQFSLSKDLQFPNSVAVNNRQEIFISDNRSHNVKVFSYKGALLRTIGQEGLTNYPIAVAINQRDQVVVADNHNNFNITVFEQDGTLVGGYESKTKHAQCFDLTVTDDGLAILTSKDFKVYCYPYQEDSPHYLQHQRR